MVSSQASAASLGLLRSRSKCLQHVRMRVKSLRSREVNFELDNGGYFRKLLNGVQSNVSRELFDTEKRIYY